MPIGIFHYAVFAAATVVAHDPCTFAVSGRTVPAVFLGDRVFVGLRLANRETLLLYTDTGGGEIAVYPEAAKRLALSVDTTHWSEGGNQGVVLWALLPKTPPDGLFPSFEGRDANKSIDLPIMDMGTPPGEEPGYTWGGRLGSMWFGGRVWTLDYPGHRFLFSDSTATGPAPPACWAPLGFQTDSTGRRVNNFPRVTAVVAGDSIQFLLDTGARTILTDSAWSALDDGRPQHRAASFITKSRFDQWHDSHPQWRVLPRAQVGDTSPMIEVPAIEVAGRKFGPVWFTERPDHNFRDFMSQYMDRPIEGALGGSAWRSVTLVIDYPRARVAVMTGDH